MRDLLTFIFLLTGYYGFSQVEFKPAYFVDNNNNKVECFIKDLDWKTNPTQFDYKKSLNGETKTIGISDVKEFIINNTSKYIRSKTQLDRSTNNLNKIGWEKQPVFREVTLFLKAVIEGSADLYMYEDDNLLRYFYRVGDDPFVQLVYKRYRVSYYETIGENNQYKQQLTNSLKCTDRSDFDFGRLGYTKNSLKEAFVFYNQCAGIDFEDYDFKSKKDLFNLRLKGGVGISSLDLSHLVDNQVYTVFPDQVSLTLALEAEFILPFKNNRWAIVAEAAYTKFDASQINREKVVRFDYKSIDVPIGLRYNRFFNSSDRMYLTASYSANIAMNSTMYYREGFVEPISPKFSPTFSLGYIKDNRFSIEINYLYRRNLLSHAPTWQAYYSRVGVMFGYNIH